MTLPSEPAAAPLAQSSSQTKVSSASAHARAFAPLDFLQLISVALIWGVNNIAAKYALMALPPLLTVSLRFVVVLIALAPLLRPLPGNWRGVLGMLLLVGPLHFGIQYIGLSLAHDLAPMVIAMQLWIPASVLFAGLILKEHISALRLGGVLLAFAGIVAMSFEPSVFAQLGPLALVGLAAACYAMGAVVVRKIGLAFDPWAMQAWIALLTTPLLGAGSLAFEHHQLDAIRHASWIVWGCLLFGGIFSSIAANAFMFRLVQKYEVSRTTPYMLMSPLISFGLAPLLLGDHITARVALGAAFTLSGVALVALAERRFR